MYQKTLGSFFSFMKPYNNCTRIQKLTLQGTNVSSKYCGQGKHWIGNLVLKFFQYSGEHHSPSQLSWKLTYFLQPQKDLHVYH